MKQLKFILPATLFFFSSTLFAQVKAPSIPPALPEQPAPPPLPPPPPPHLKITKKQGLDHFKKIKENEPAKQPERPAPPPPPASPKGE